MGLKKEGFNRVGLKGRGLIGFKWAGLRMREALKGRSLEWLN